MKNHKKFNKTLLQYFSIPLSVIAISSCSDQTTSGSKREILKGPVADLIQNSKQVLPGWEDGQSTLQILKYFTMPYSDELQRSSIDSERLKQIVVNIGWIFDEKEIPTLNKISEMSVKDTQDGNLVRIVQLLLKVLNRKVVDSEVSNIRKMKEKHGIKISIRPHETGEGESSFVLRLFDGTEFSVNQEEMCSIFEKTHKKIQWEYDIKAA